MVGGRYYHLDCALARRRVQQCANVYMGYVDDKSLYPIVMRILNTLIYRNSVPSDWILRTLRVSGGYYANKSVFALYGLRKLFWEVEMQKNTKRTE